MAKAPPGVSRRRQPTAQTAKQTMSQAPARNSGVGAWLIVCLVVCAVGWRRRETPGGAFAIGVAGSAALYVLTFFAAGVASDFRYAYWAVLAGIAGSVVAALPRPPPT